MLARLGEGIGNDAPGRAVLALSLRRLAPALDGAQARDAIDAMAGLGIDLATAPRADLLTPALEVLAQRGTVHFEIAEGAMTMRALTPDFSLDRSPPDPAARYRLSRFAWAGLDTGVLALRSPLSDRWFVLHDPAAVALLAGFAEPQRIEDAIAGTGNPPQARAIVDAVIAAQMLLACDAAGNSIDQRDPARRMWDFPDLLLHSRSRQGRTDLVVGGDYPFRETMALPSTEVAMAPVTEWHDLPPATALPPMALDNALFRRRSIRSFADAPLPLERFSTLLRYALRGEDGDGGTLRRPFPNGGAHYEQCFFLVLDRVEGLPRGLYRYDEGAHRLGRMAAQDAAIAGLIDDAARSGGNAGRPAALLVIASRFGMVRWKYSGLSYALQLKHVGVVMQTLYLVATALELGGYAIGTGNTDRFGALAGLDYLEAGAIGEFAFGLPAA